MQIPRQKSPIGGNKHLKRTSLSIALIILLSAILAVLAVLQYRWSGQLGEAEHERMQASLRAAMSQFRAQFHNELLRLDFLFQPDATILSGEDWQSYAANCRNLMGGTDLHLVRNIWLWIAAANGGSQLHRLNRDAPKFEAASWPPGFESIRDRHIQAFSPSFQTARGLRPFDRFVNLDIPLILHPLIKFQPSSDLRNQRFLGFLLLELNRTTLREAVFPELAKRYFGSPDGFVYHVAVVKEQSPPDFIYASDPVLTVESFAQLDAHISLLENPRPRFSPGGPMPERSGPPPPRPPFRPEPPGRGGRPGVLPVLEQDGPAVEVLALHREGSLDAAVAKSRRRNLAISFGSLLLLAVSIALILVFSKRAQRLARLQIDFVAGVSHELRTPLAVICSAGDNLADGVAGNSESSARKYGELIRKEGRKLTAMIEQILKFASMRSGRYQYNLSPANINGIVLHALEQSKALIQDSFFSVETNLDPDLPMVKVDSAVLSQAIQNLIQNALKYSGESRWMMLRTEKTPTKRNLEIRLSIEDKGLGIDGEDLSRIFEPFYRGGGALAAQIHGTGLGLFMVQEAVVSMGGKVTVRSTHGKGSVFTIHLPGCPASAEYSAPSAERGNPNDAVQNSLN